MSVHHRIVALSIVAASAACGGGEPPAQLESDVPAATTADAPALLAQLTDEQAEGRVLFQSVCWTCHGTSGRGDGPTLQSDAAIQPPNFIAEGYADIPAEELLTRFEASLTGDGVDAEHPHMRAVLSVLKPERFRAALSYVPALAYPPELPGSALTGMELYEARCVGCHGSEGNGDGYAAEALVIPPADFHSDTLVARGDFDALFERIRNGGGSIHGSSMPPWGVALSDPEIWDLVAYVATFEEGLLPPLPGAGG